MTPLEFEIMTPAGDVVAKTSVPEETGDHQIANSSLTVDGIVPGRRNGRDAIKAIHARVSPPFSDGRPQRFSFNGPSSEVVPPVADNTLGGGRYRARVTIMSSSNNHSGGEEKGSL